MVLKSERFMPAFGWRYCGIRLEGWNHRSPSLLLSGGNAPVTGFHSVIDSPDSVSRVAPPTSTMIAISPATDHSQTRKAVRSDILDVLVMKCWAGKPRSGRCA